MRETHPEVVGAGKVQAWVVGSGSGEGAEAALDAALADGVPLVVDADALIHAERARDVPRVLTPHAGELARMLGTDRDLVESQPLRHARDAAEKYAAVVLLKGRHTPDRRSRRPGPGHHDRHTRGWPPPAPATCWAA